MRRISNLASELTEMRQFAAKVEGRFANAATNLKTKKKQNKNNQRRANQFFRRVASILVQSHFPQSVIHVLIPYICKTTIYNRKCNFV